MVADWEDFMATRTILRYRARGIRNICADKFDRSRSAAAAPFERADLRAIGRPLMAQAT